MSDDEDKKFRGEYESTAAAMVIIKTYGHPAEKQLGKQKYRMKCDMFQAAARHTGLIDRMIHYWSAYTGQWMVHIPSLVKAAHGVLHWTWNDEDECDLCPNKPLCYDDHLKDKADDKGEGK